MAWQDQIEARTRSQARYDKEHCVRVSLKLNLERDSDIISWLNKQPSKQGAIKRLIMDAVFNERLDKLLGEK